MVNPENIAQVLQQNSWAKELRIDTGPSPHGTLQFAKKIIDACCDLDVPLKGVRVDPFVAAAFNGDEDFSNALIYRNCVIVLDPRLQDQVEVVRR